ncbi:hypothetical protein [Achromobacter denitrificans]|uniref:hypothetical protein n=1 Tax=Achromobacter denitrificans TaxID=32002 RepID=UPI0023E86087|nr:hypothetical protein [Achromobacter denitrificans]MDF3847550.1 hypothetical protein [Achromobacter denitrificans]
MAYLGATANSLVLDPWGGSGTTGIVASRNGTPALCLDINPAMATFAASKSPLVLMHEEEILEFFHDLANGIVTTTDVGFRKDDPLGTAFSPSSVCIIHGVIEAIPFPAYTDPETDAIAAIHLAVQHPEHLINPAYGFAMAVLFVTLRELSGSSSSANPTWVKSGLSGIELQRESFFRDLSRNAQNMLADLREFFRHHNSPAINFSLAADARKLPLKDNSVDFVITSPPYLTRIDYAVSTYPELSLFGNAELLSYLRHNTMGAPVITKEPKQQRMEWGDICNRVLNMIAEHPTKAARSYYWKNIVQYFMDMDFALDEIRRVLKPHGQALVVVQSSYFKDVEIPLGEIYFEMGKNKGLTSEIAFREEVKGHMAHVNTKSSVYKKNKIYFEDFVHFTKT